MGLYHHVEHPHIAKRRPPPSVKDEAGTGANAKVALAVTGVVGTMWAAYAFAVVALISLPAAILTGQPIVIVAWIAQTFLQLVLLPVIIVGQNIQGAASDARADSTYKDAEAILAESHEIHHHLEAQDVVLSKLIAGRSGDPTP